MLSGGELAQITGIVEPRLLCELVTDLLKVGDKYWMAFIVADRLLGNGLELFSQI